MDGYDFCPQIKYVSLGFKDPINTLQILYFVKIEFSRNRIDVIPKFYSIIERISIDYLENDYYYSNFFLVIFEHY